MGCKAGKTALPSLLWKQRLSVSFPFQALLLKTLKASRKKPFLTTVSPESLGEAGAQPMGASRLLEGATVAHGRSAGKDQP